MYIRIGLRDHICACIHCNIVLNDSSWLQTHLCVRTCMHTCMHAHIHPYTHTIIHACMHACTRTYTRQQLPRPMHTHAHSLFCASDL